MSKVEFVPFLLTETTDIFSIRINGDRMTELEKFLIMFKDSENKYVQSDLESYHQGHLEYFRKRCIGVLLSSGGKI